MSGNSALVYAQVCDMASGFKAQGQNAFDI
jgi:hypothetical protein